MIPILATIGAILLALFVAGLILTLVVKLTTTVGAFVKNLVFTIKKRISGMLIKKAIEDLRKQKDKENAEKMTEALGQDAIAFWFEGTNGEVEQDSIKIIKGEDVDERTKMIFEMNDGLIAIEPSGV